MSVVPPVHRKIVESACNRVPRHHSKRLLEEGRELVAVHLARTHLKFAMLGAAKPADEALDRQIVGRVAEADRGLLHLHQSLPGARVESITAQETMTTKLPKVSSAGDGLCLDLNRGFFVVGSIVETIDPQI